MKSPLYSVLWVAGYLSYLVVSGEWDLFRRKHIWGAWLLGGLVGASWYLAVLAVDGQRFWSDYLIRETWAKNSGNGSTIGGFWLAMLYFCFPFTLLIIPALQVVWKKRRSGPMLNFLFAWSWAPALFFTFYPYRTRPYLYILVPVLAILVDQACFRVWHSKFLRATAWATGVLFALVLATVGFVLWRAELVSPLVSAGFVAIGALGAWAGVKGQMRGFVIAALGAVLLFRFSAVSIGETDLAGLRTAVKESPGVPVAMLDEKRNIWHELGLVSAALGKPVERLYDLDQAADALQQGRMVVLSDVQSAELLASLEAKLLGRSDLRSVEKREWWRWKGRLKFPFKELILHGRAGVPDFEEKTKRRFLILTLAKPLLNAGPIQGEIYEWEVDVDGRGRPGRSGRVEWLRKDGAEGAKRDRARPGSFS